MIAGNGGSGSCPCVPNSGSGVADPASLGLADVFRCSRLNAVLADPLVDNHSFHPANAISSMFTSSSSFVLRSLVSSPGVVHYRSYYPSYYQSPPSPRPHLSDVEWHITLILSRQLPASLLPMRRPPSPSPHLPFLSAPRPQIPHPLLSLPYFRYPFPQPRPTQLHLQSSGPCL